MSGVLIGKNGFLGAALSTSLPGKWAHLSYKDVTDSALVLKNADIVINCAYNPALRHADYNQSNDIDHSIARMIGPKTFYVMLSTRMVYGESLPGPRPFLETDECRPANMYGKNKLTVEENLKRLLGQERLVLLRLSNIFGLEPGRPTFMGAAQTSLKRTGEIIFDLAPDSKRDFLPVKYLAESIEKIVASPVAGTFNIGSGIQVSCDEISSWLIEGYGNGRTVYTDTSQKGQFVLDIEKASRTFDLTAIAKGDIRTECIECGRKLR